MIPTVPPNGPAVPYSAEASDQVKTGHTPAGLTHSKRCPTGKGPAGKQGKRLTDWLQIHGFVLSGTNL